jgi:hypothetical protein
MDHHQVVCKPDMKVKTQQTYILSCKQQVTVRQVIEQIQKLVKVKVKVKIKVTLEQSTKAQRWSRGIVQLKCDGTR